MIGLNIWHNYNPEKLQKWYLEFFDKILSVIYYLYISDQLSIKMTIMCGYISLLPKNYIDVFLVCDQEKLIHVRSCY